MNIYFDLCDLKRMPFDSMDMVIVLSNLLDNATRAAAGPCRRRCMCASAKRRKNT